MTQANSRPTLSLQLTALQLPDNGSLGKFALSRRQPRDSSQTRLRVDPGEPSEILLRLFNQSEASLTVYLQLEIEPEIAPNWCQWYSETVNNGFIQPEAIQGLSYHLTLEPQQQQNLAIEFNFPQTFFEEQQAIHS